LAISKTKNTLFKQDKSVWDAFEVLVESATESIDVICLRRRYLPTLAEYYQDFVLEQRIPLTVPESVREGNIFYQLLIIFRMS